MPDNALPRSKVTSFVLARGVNGSRVFFVEVGASGKVVTSHSISDAHHFRSKREANLVGGCVAVIRDSYEWRAIAAPPGCSRMS